MINKIDNFQFPPHSRLRPPVVNSFQIFDSSYSFTFLRSLCFIFILTHTALFALPELSTFRVTTSNLFLPLSSQSLDGNLKLWSYYSLANDVSFSDFPETAQLTSLRMHNSEVEDAGSPILHILAAMKEFSHNSRLPLVSWSGPEGKRTNLHRLNEMIT